MSMRAYLIFISALLLIFCLLEYYAFCGMCQVFDPGLSETIFSVVYFISVIFSLYGFKIYFEFWKNDTINQSLSFNLISGMSFALLIGKLFFCLLLFSYDVVRLVIAIPNLLQYLFTSAHDVQEIIPARQKLVNLAALTLSAIPLFIVIYGVTIGKYRYEVERLSLAFDDLPSAFDGFKIVQISDAHAGSWDSMSQVKKGIDLINALKPDLILFTGDLVNLNPDEIDPYVALFAELSAPYGKFAIMGNHDYYGLKSRETRAEKYEYFDRFVEKHARMGFQMLNNQHICISRNNASFNLIGVENWGRGRWFPKRGNLDKATYNMPKDGFNLLMSHDPTHWEDIVLQHSQKIHLTLSGHTHGSQFGIKYGKYKWSPVQYTYQRWMGLYQEKDQILYVNRGFGYLGFPGRIGMWPEITLIELRSKTKDKSNPGAQKN